MIHLLLLFTLNAHAEMNHENAELAEMRQERRRVMRVESGERAVAQTREDPQEHKDEGTDRLME